MYEMSMSPIPSPTVHFGENSRVSDFVHDDNRAMRVASALLDGGAYLVDTTLSEEDYFTWKSGVRAPCYCNCRYAVSDYRTRTVIAVEMAGMIQETFSRVDNIVGIANAGIPWATSVADQLELPMAYLRPDKKAHGIGGHVQGRIRKGSRIVIL
jgi:orotate phosphoribosyltransferase